MNKTTYTLALLIALFASATTLSAQSEAEYQKLTKAYTLRADGSQELRCSMELTLFTHTAMNSTYGETFIVYDPRHQKLTINSSYTRRKDGSTVKTPDNAFVEVLPRSAADAPAYNHLKEMVIVHTALELGATICLDYTLTTEAGYLPELDVFEEIEKSSPVKDYTISLSVPESKPLAYTLHGMDARPMVTTDGGMKTATWHLHNVAAASREPFVTAAGGDVPFLAASTYTSCGDALGGLFSQFAPATDLQLQAIAESLTEGKKNDTEKLQAILRHVVEEVGFSAVSLGEAGYRLRSVSDVFYSAYATAAEKTNLLHGLLRAAGIGAEVAASYRAAAPQDCLALSAIGSLVVIARADGRQYVLSPTSKMMPAAGCNIATPLISLSNAGSPVALPTADAHIDCEVAVNVTVDKAESTHKASLGEAHLPYYGDDITAYAGKTTSTQTLSARSGYVTLLLPDAPVSLSHSRYPRLNSARTSNILMPYMVDEHYTYTVSLPPCMKLATAETDKVIENEAGTLVFRFSKNGDKTLIERSLKLRKQLYTPAEFGSLRRLLTEWGDAQGRTLLLSVE